MSYFYELLIDELFIWIERYLRKKTNNKGWKESKKISRNENYRDNM